MDCLYHELINPHFIKVLCQVFCHINELFMSIQKVNIRGIQGFEATTLPQCMPFPGFCDSVLNTFPHSQLKCVLLVLKALYAEVLC